MCDYSLELYRSRPAQEGEVYRSHRFPSHTVGFISEGDTETAVCMACDQRLRLEDLPAAVQNACGVGTRADATFTRLDTAAHRDAVRFDNGAEISLQQLGPGVRATLIDALSERRDTRELARAV